VQEAVVEPPPEFLRQEQATDQTNFSRVELLLETHRVTGRLDRGGAPRRLVDILNTTDAPTVALRDVGVEKLAEPEVAPLTFDIAHVKCSAILLAIPDPEMSPPSGGLEAVQKSASRATLLLPGVEVSGDVYFAPDADPRSVPLLGRRDFMPVTDAEIAQVAFVFRRWREQLVVVNLARALVYAPDSQ
jgi:hypothetical protein